MERPKRAYIRQEWYSAVINILDERQRCAFYESIISYCYFGVVNINDPLVRASFEMIKGYLQADVASYEKVVLRNRSNASKKESVTKKKTQTHPVGPSGTQRTPNNIYIKEDKSKLKNLSLSSSADALAERKRYFLIYKEFFIRGVIKPSIETGKMIDYYSARGWVDKGGNKIIDYSALARIWRVAESSTDVYVSECNKSILPILEHLDNSLLDMVDISLFDHFCRLKTQNTNGMISLVVFVTSSELVNLFENQLFEVLKEFCDKNGVNSITYQIQSLEEREFDIKTRTM